MLALDSGVNSLSRSNKAKHFSGVRLRLRTFFIWGQTDMSEPFTFYRNIDGAGRIVIPQDVRKAVGLQFGDEVTIRITQEGILLCPVKPNSEGQRGE